MKLTVDIENTVSKLPSGKTLLDPFTEGNRLVLVCTKKDTGEESSFWFDHATHSTDSAKELLQEQLPYLFPIPQTLLLHLVVL